MPNHRTALPTDIAQIIEAEKSFPFTPVWDDLQNPRYSIITAALSAEGITAGGLRIRLHASKKFAARDSLAQLEYYVSSREVVNLTRCQWRPFETHQNDANGPPGFELEKFVDRSHHHTFSDNYIASENRMRGKNLPGAIPIHPDPTSLSDFLDYVGKCFKINNMNLLALPNTSQDLFWTPI